MNSNFCYILGSGPTLRDFDWAKANQDLIIGLNSLVFDANFNKAKYKILAFHDKRFLSETAFLKQAKLHHGNTVITNRYNSEQAQKLFNIQFNCIDDYILDNKIYQDYLREFPEPIDLLRNAVFEIALPLAVGLGYKNIKMFGCSFDYGMQKKNKPEYYNCSVFKTFEQTRETAENWSKFNLNRYTKLISWGLKYGIEISRL